MLASHKLQPNITMTEYCTHAHTEKKITAHYHYEAYVYVIVFHDVSSPRRMICASSTLQRASCSLTAAEAQAAENDIVVQGRPSFSPSS